MTRAEYARSGSLRWQSGQQSASAKHLHELRHRSADCRRSMRSAMTPPNREKRKIGISPRKASRPSRKGDFVMSRTSQFCAISCIHVPMVDVQAPIQRSRKSRYWNALKTRRSTRCRGGRSLWQRFLALDQMEQVAVGVVEENQAVAQVSKGSPQKVTPLLLQNVHAASKSSIAMAR